MIKIKTEKEIEIMRQGGKLLAGIMEKIKAQVKPGISTNELERLTQSLVLQTGGTCSFKGYEGFPSCLCVSVNQEIVHGTPSDIRLKNGDILTLDLGLFYKGYHTDMAVTLAIGKIDPETNRLLKVCKKALKLGIKKLRPGNTFGDVGNTIQRHIESQGFSVVKDLCGHGIGKDLHEDPQILNHGKRKKGEKIKKGMVVCLEPMIAMKKGDIEKKGFVYKTEDNSLSAHFELTIAVNSKGGEVLTKI